MLDLTFKPKRERIIMNSQIKIAYHFHSYKVTIAVLFIETQNEFDVD